MTAMCQKQSILTAASDHFGWHFLLWSVVGGLAAEAFSGFAPPATNY
jgi:hypothetical protein